ncbi:MAG: HAMP domain-containing protein [Chloroflexi bacterium]|nr:HAMP domain-containing protein [Chloroflexota bacterium]
MSSLRTRLIVAYTGLILLGFGMLTVLAGSQLSSAVRSDYQDRLVSETNLVAEGVRQYLNKNAGSTIDQTEIDAALAIYQGQIEGAVSFEADARPNFAPGNNPPPGSNNPPLQNRAGQPNIQQQNGDLLISAPITVDSRMLGRLEVRVPSSSVDQAVTQRWLELAAGLLTLTLLAIGASVWLSNTLIRPLRTLRQSALRLSQGDFSERIAYTGVDEVTEVVSAFNEMAFQVESMLEEQRAFASNTSHELRTPLTTIRLRTEALRDDPSLDGDTQRQYVIEVDDEVKRLSSLVTDLTLLSRLDAGRAELGSEQIDFVRFAEQSERQMRAHAQQSRIELALVTPAAPIIMQGSLSHLTVIFRNLLDNAIKYSPSGTKIEWRIDLEGGRVHSQMIDQGRGIAAEHLPHVFERFYRADKARSREIPGTGLGLALVKSIVDAYNGEIRVESAGKDQGTTVHIWLPLTHPQKAIGDHD